MRNKPIPEQDCPRCGEPMELYAAPEARDLFRIPFTRWTIVVVDYDKAVRRCSCKSLIQSLAERMDFDNAVNARIDRMIERGML